MCETPREMKKCENKIELGLVSSLNFINDVTSIKILRKGRKHFVFTAKAYFPENKCHSILSRNVNKFRFQSLKIYKKRVQKLIIQPQLRFLKGLLLQQKSQQRKVTATRLARVISAITLTAFMTLRTVYNPNDARNLQVIRHLNTS
ncbi:hypothetical protein PoB_006151500 [Plakobranchus ocellatus]|uniref:Uncharacterized protein n=1 Tax=Plakobranchus ocellatus TaxID=259542 RepID=A0AAV4CSX0_9GAST|nr:hypothetical protein PoB_006151500 [Plakobranchus ocellatus]